MNKAICTVVVRSTWEGTSLYTPLEVCRASQPVSSINYDSTKLSFLCSKPTLYDWVLHSVTKKPSKFNRVFLKYLLSIMAVCSSYAMFYIQKCWWPMQSVFSWKTIVKTILNNYCISRFFIWTLTDHENWNTSQKTIVWFVFEGSSSL